MDNKDQVIKYLQAKAKVGVLRNELRNAELEGALYSLHDAVSTLEVIANFNADNYTNEELKKKIDKLAEEIVRYYEGE